MDKLIIGCGYLGQRVAALWRDQGHRVLATTRHPRALGDSTLVALHCDVLDPNSLHQLPEADTVLYAIGFDRSSGDSMRSVYVDGLAIALAYLPSPGGLRPTARQKTGKFIYISSSSVYGQTDGGWVDEDSPTQPEEESGKIVLAAEEVLRSKRPDAVILRFAGIYGPGRLLRQKAIQAGEPIVGDGAKWLNLIHVDDGARAVLAAEEHATPGRIYNVCDDHPVQRHVFYRALASSLRAPEPKFMPPPPVIPTPPHEKANRRLRNQRLRQELRFSLRYPHHEVGIRASCEKKMET